MSTDAVNGQSVHNTGTPGRPVHDTGTPDRPVHDTGTPDRLENASKIIDRCHENASRAADHNFRCRENASRAADYKTGDFVWVLFEAENYLAKILHVLPDEKYKIEWWYFAYPPIDDEAPCLICEKHPEVFILCDCCNRGGCLPCFGLEAVPDGPWYCGKCKSQQELLGVPDEYWSRVRKNDLILDNDYQPQDIEAACIQDRADVTGYAQRLMLTRPKGRKRKFQYDWIQKIPRKFL